MAFETLELKLLTLVEDSVIGVHNIHDVDVLKRVNGYCFFYRRTRIY